MSSVLAFRMGRVGTDVEFNLTGQGEAVRLVGTVASANLFSVLGREAMLGRTFEPATTTPATTASSF